MWRLYNAFRLQAIVLESEQSTRTNSTLGGFNNSQAKPVLESFFFRNGTVPILPPDVPTTVVDNINSARAGETLDRFRPDIVCVAGTHLIRQPLLDRIPLLPLGMINFHTGLCPYSRGANCNLFMLIEGHPELVGITIHHIDHGIDNGDIIISSRPDMAPNDNFEIIDGKAVRLGNECMVAAVGQLHDGTAARVPQWTEGKLFVRRTGYVWDPSLHVKVNGILAEGLIKDYFARKEELDVGVRLISAP
jgi:methionyl-tRNA formyltransferase